MRKKTKQPIDRAALLQSPAGTLAQIAAKTNFLTQLAHIVRQICPDIPDEAYQIANFRQSAIVIEVKSSVWGQRLQFERVKISKALEELSQNQFNQIEIKVNPYYAKTSPQNTNINHRDHYISYKAAEHIENLAKTAPQGLKEKLHRLALLAKNK